MKKEGLRTHVTTRLDEKKEQMPFLAANLFHPLVTHVEYRLSHCVFQLLRV